MSVPMMLLRARFPLVEITPNVTSGGYIVSALPQPGTRSPAFQPFPLALPQSVLNGLYVLGEYQAMEQQHEDDIELVPTADDLLIGSDKLVTAQASDGGGIGDYALVKKSEGGLLGQPPLNQREPARNAPGDPVAGDGFGPGHVGGAVLEAPVEGVARAHVAPRLLDLQDAAAHRGAVVA